MAEKFYIKVPHPDGTSKEVAVDLSRLHRGVINQVYEMTSIKNGKRLIPVMESQRMVNQNLDVSGLQIKLQEILIDCSHALDEFGETGKTVFDEMLKPLQALSNLMKAIATDNLDLANEILTQFGFDLMSGSATISQSLSMNTNHASAMTVAYESVANLEKAPEIVHHMAVEWATEAEVVLKTVETLQIVEDNFDTVIRNISNERDRRIHEIEYVSLSGNQSLQEFLLETRNFLLGDSETVSHAKLGQLLGLAKGVITHLEETLTRVSGVWHNARTNFQAALITDDKEVGVLTSDLERSTRNVRDLGERFFKCVGGNTRPCDFKDPPISPERYAKVEKIMQAREWAPKTAQRRLYEKATNIRHMLLETFDFSETTKGLIESSNTRMSQVSLIRDDDSHEVETFQVGSPSPQNDIEVVFQPIVISAKALELYEFLLCVGSLTCNKILFNATTPSVMIKIMGHMVEYSNDEIELYRSELQELIDRNTDDIEMKEATVQWEGSKKHWIRYNTNAKSQPVRMKLTLSAVPYVEGLMKKHSLSPGMVEVARKMKDEAENTKPAKKSAAYK